MRFFVEVVSSLVVRVFLLPCSVACFSSPPKPSLGQSRSDIIDSLSLYDDSGGPHSHCYEVRPTPLPEDAEEDEVDLWYPTRRRAFVFGTGSDAVAEAAAAQQQRGRVVTVRQTSFGCGKLGASVWPSSIALCLHLVANPTSVRGRRVLELGAGCGLPSALCRDDLGVSSVLATDFWEVEDEILGDKRKEPIPTRLHSTNLDYNVGGDTVAVQRVDWHDLSTVQSAKSFGADFIIGSDLVYYSSNVEPLIDTLKVLLDDNGGALEALLIAPLPPEAERESLPEFRRKLPLELPGHFVQMDEIALHRKQNGEIRKFLRIDISRSTVRGPAQAI